MTDPVQKFSEWFEEAKGCKDIADATVMCLATVYNNQPSARMVLLKDFDARGFAFYTNLESHKSAALKANPDTALCFYWEPLGKQVRIEGMAELVSAAEADAYFATRARESQIGAWASAQSKPLASREALLKSFHDYSKKFEGKSVPRPPHWSGWRVIPDAIEFWQQGDHRLHERELFTRHHDHWHVQILYP